MWLLVRGSLLMLSVEPFMVNRTGVSEGNGDLMTLIHFGLGTVMPLGRLHLVSYIAAAAASAGCAWWLFRHREDGPRRDAAVIAVASLMFFTHLIYDYVFLAVPAAACLRGTMDRRKAVALSAMGLIVYGIKITRLFGLSPKVLLVTVAVVFALLATVLVQVSEACDADAVYMDTEEQSQMNTIEIAG
jgi:hypothetical protein